MIKCFTTQNMSVDYVHVAMGLPPFIFIMVYVSLSSMEMPLGYGEFGFHPALMTLSFGVFGCMASMSYRVGEGVLGWSHSFAKTVHGGLHFLAIFIIYIYLFDWVGSF